MAYNWEPRITEEKGTVSAMKTKYFKKGNHDMSRNSERDKFIELLNKKRVFSRFSDFPVTFVDDIDELEEEKGVFSDGLNLLDNIEEAEDDIQQMYFVLKDGSFYNCQDFYSDFGAYEEGDKFIKNIEKYVMDRKGCD